LLPSLCLGIEFGSETHAQVSELLLVAVAAATLVVGASRRLQALVVLGAGALTIQAAVLLAPWVAVVNSEMPFWGWLAGLGLALLLLGAGYERRLRQFRTVRSRLAALR
jgi:hypothetical protein